MVVESTALSAVRPPPRGTFWKAISPFTGTPEKVSPGPKAPSSKGTVPTLTPPANLVPLLVDVNW